MAGLLSVIGNSDFNRKQIMPPTIARKIVNQEMLDEIKKALQNNHIAMLF